MTDAPPGKPIITIPSSEICEEKMVEVTCNWTGGYPNATLRLSCLSTKKEGNNFVTIKILVPKNANKTCICEGFHDVKKETESINLNIQCKLNGFYC